MSFSEINLGKIRVTVLPHNGKIVCRRLSPTRAALNFQVL